MSQPVALVTGGGSGIGLAVTEHLINFHGYRVAVLDINAERGKAEVTRLNASADNCLFLHVDVTSYDQQAQAFKQTYEWGGNRLDLFFANAGIGDTDSIYKNLCGIDEATGLPKPLHLTCLDVNLNAVLQGIHLARHFFQLRGKGGKIVITASCVGVYHLHAAPQYTASKYALVGLVRATAPVFASLNPPITINALLPTLLETNIIPASVRPLWDREGFTPLSTACKAFDVFLTMGSMTGQTVELCKDELVFSRQKEYATANSRWMCEETRLWEMVCEPLLPKPVGENYTVLE